MSPLQQNLGLSPAHHNQFLFSDHYLNNLLPEDPRWTDALPEAEALLRWLQDLFTREQPQLTHYNEAQLEEHWFRPIFSQLGHVFERRASVPGLERNIQYPDYVFFPHETARQAAVQAQRTSDYAAHALAVGEVKAWDVSLAKKAADGEGRFDQQNPSFQIDYYLRAAGLEWGVLSNGRLWRLVHHDTSQRLSIYYEVDLVDLLTRSDASALRYFTLFFRQAAFLPNEQGRCFLDDALAQSNQYAVALENDLRENVYQALEQLMQGFYDLPGNQLSPDDLPHIYENSLYLLYRFLFILYAESRGLLPLDNPRYAQNYSLKRLKEEIAGLSSPLHSRTTRYWDDIQTLFQIINGDDAGLNREIGVPRYNGGLFNPALHPFLAEKKVGDRALVEAIDLLCRRQTPSGRREFVDYRTLSVRHLGSIYEGLLEYQPRLAQEAMAAVREGKGERWRPAAAVEGMRILDRRQPGEIYLETDRGERKATGSYYTPQYIVEYIVQNTLGPLVEEARQRVAELSQAARNKADQHAARQTLVDEILALKVLDPAMGSGHFLVEATEFLALALATDPYAQSAASAEEDLTHWRRQLVERCIYGVDKNPLAVELAKLSLWLSTVAADRPLSFLDHHLKCGDSLVGARVSELGWAPSPVLSKQALKEQQQRRAGQISTFEYRLSQQLPAIMGRVLEIVERDSDSYEDVQAKEAADLAVRQLKAPFEAVADLWVSAYFGHSFIHGEYDDALEALTMPEKLAGLSPVTTACRLGQERRFFHWELAFPEVFYDRNGQSLGPSAGFDAVIGNPPYGIVFEEKTKQYLEKNFPSFIRNNDLYTGFSELAIKLAHEHGLISLIIPNTFILGPYFTGLKEYLLAHTQIIQIDDFGFAQIFSDPNVFSSIFVVTKSKDGNKLLTILREAHIEKGKIIPYETEEVLLTSLPLTRWKSFSQITSKSNLLSTPLEPICFVKDVGFNYWSIGRKKTRGNSSIGDRILYDGAQQHFGDTPYIKGGDFSRYELPQSGKHWLRNDFKKLLGAQDVFRYSEEFLKVPEKIMYRQTSDRIIATLDRESHLVDKTVHVILFKEQNLLYSLSYVLAVINSRLLGYIYADLSREEDRTFAQVKVFRIEQLPIRCIAFNTPEPERQRLAQEARQLYAAAVAGLPPSPEPAGFATRFAGLLDFTARRLPAPDADSAANEQSDVVHDLLAFLAGEMIELNRRKQTLAAAFWSDLQGVTEPSAFTRLKGKGKQESTLARLPACRPYVNSASGSSRTLEDSLAWDEEAFKAFAHELAGKLSGLSRLAEVWQEHAPHYTALSTRLLATDWLIDQIVYRLYNLTEEEIRLIEEEKAPFPQGEGAE